MIFIVVKFEVKPDRADEWLELTREFTEATRAEPGNISFDWSRSTDNPNQFILVESFQDDAAEAHVNSEHFKKATSWMPDLITKTPSIINTTLEQNDWSEMAELKPR